jgi:predicted NBD/HSP70 family sugar kinase
VKRIHPHNYQKAGKQTIRDINRAIVLNTIRNRQPIPRVEIAKLTGLRNSTVSLIVAQLFEDGFLQEGIAGPSSGGRKPTLLSLNARRFQVIGVDIGVIDTVLGIADFNGVILHHEQFHTQPDPDDFVQDLAERVKGAITRHHLPNCEELGVSIRGLIDPLKGRIFFTPTLGWHDYEIKQCLEKELGLRVYIENNANACALAELWFGTASQRGFHDFVYLTVNEGVGAGVICNGRLVRGHCHSAGEFGHILLTDKGPQCGCGKQGCWEAYASNTALLERYLHGHPATSRDSFRGAIQHLSTISIPHLINLARNNDAKARQALMETAKFLGLGITIILSALDPEAIFIGGDITQGWDLIEGIIGAQITPRVLHSQLASTLILPSHISRPGLLGAVALVLEKYFVVQMLN